MIKTKIDLKRCIKIEKELYSLSFKSKFLGLFNASEKGIIWKYQKNLRKFEYFFNNNKTFIATLYRLKVQRIGIKYGLSIGPNCFDEGLKISHLGRILINSNARVGKNCLINVNVSLIATNGNECAPRLGNDCKIGVGATLIGGISIGNKVAIGAGAVVTKSFVDEHITIAGNPAKIISNKALL